MSEKIYEVDQFYTGDFAQILTGDYILHHCTVLNIKGESYRLKDRRKGNPPPYREK